MLPIHAHHARGGSDWTIWVRHDDVKHYQEAGLAQCETDAGSDAAAKAACTPKWKMDKTSEVCELVLYQSLSHKTMTTGAGTLYDGFQGFYDRDRQNILDFRTQDQKINNGHDDDSVPNGYTAQLPGGGVDHYTQANPINAVPNRYENYTGDIQHDQLAEIGGPHAQWDYGGRTRAETSVKVTCCHYDGKANDQYTTADNWGDDNDPSNVLNGERRRKRFCPPDERWYDDPGPYVEYVQEGDSVEVDTQQKIDDLKFGDWVCFKNRTVVAEVLMASIDDYNEANTQIAADYQGINNKTTGILYKEEDVWNQDKSETSFYQVRATHLPANCPVPT